jgi:tetratricopeptide (TPR) repeat protein
MTIRHFLLILAFGATAAHADMSACASAFVKESVDERINLYTICLTSGGMTRQNLAGAFNNRGVAYLEKGDVEHAFSDFGNSIKYDPKWGRAYLNRALIYLDRGDLESAEADLTGAIKNPLPDGRSVALYYRAVIRMARGACAEAVKDLDVAIHQDKKMGAAYAAKAWVLSTCPDDSQRNGNEALELAQKALSLQDRWQFHDALAAAYAELGRFEDGARESRQAGERLDADAAAAHWRSSLQARGSLYEARQPYRERASEAETAAEWLQALQ